MVSPPEIIVLPIGEAIIRSVLDPKAPRLLALNSGVGAGKSTALAQGIHLAAYTRPGSTHLVSMETYGDLHSIMYPRLAAVIGNSARWVGGTVNPRFIYPNGSRVELVNYMMPEGRVESRNAWEGRDATTLWVDEVETLNGVTLFDHSFQRCRLKSRDISGNVHDPLIVWCGRPGHVTHWMDKAEELARAGMSVAQLVFPTRSNWLLSDAYLDNMRRSMSKAEFECVTQEVLGARMPTRGAIYSCFDPALNVLDFPLDRAYPTYCAVDFGVHTSAVLFIQEHGGKAIICDEWCPDEATSTRDLVQSIRARGFTHLVEAICDPAGTARQRAAGLASEVDIMRRDIDSDPDGLGAGLGCYVHAHVPPDRRGVRDGILRVQARIEAADGSRSLFVRRALWDRPEGKRGIRHSLLAYAWDERTGEPKKGARGEHADHVCDALRMYIARRAWSGPPGADGWGGAAVVQPPPSPTPRRHAAGPGTGRGQSWRRGH